jgi:4-hydroxybenzoate polyprenyltransferase
MESTVETSSRIKEFLRDIKFEHSVFALPFAYLGLILAEGGWPRPNLLIWVTLAMVSFRTFAMAVNRLVDRAIDARNPRTRSRALPQEALSPRFVRRAALFSLSVFAVSAWILGPLCFFLAPIPVFLTVVYPFLKRFTWSSHGVLGIILGMAPYGAWMASRGGFSWVPGLLWIGIACWVAGFDILYSLQDVDFDQQAGLKSVPVRFGIKGAAGISAALHLAAVLAWAGVGILAPLGWVYAVGVGTVAVFLTREHWLIRRFGLARINEAFFTMNAAASCALFFAAAADFWAR